MLPALFVRAALLVPYDDDLTLKVAVNPAAERHEEKVQHEDQRPVQDRRA